MAWHGCVKEAAVASSSGSGAIISVAPVLRRARPHGSQSRRTVEDPRPGKLGSAVQPAPLIPRCRSAAQASKVGSRDRAAGWGAPSRPAARSPEEEALGGMTPKVFLRRPVSCPVVAAPQSPPRPWSGRRKFGDPGRARTYDLPLRRRLLYPAELRSLVPRPGRSSPPAACHHVPHARGHGCALPRARSSRHRLWHETCSRKLMCSFNGRLTRIL